MASNFERGEAAGIERGLAACRVLLDKLAAARQDSAEWKEQHENLLAMFRDAEQRAVRAERALRDVQSQPGWVEVDGYLEAVKHCGAEAIYWRGEGVYCVVGDKLYALKLSPPDTQEER